MEAPPTLPDGKSQGSPLTSILPMIGMGVSLTVMMVMRNPAFMAIGAVVLCVALFGALAMLFSRRGQVARRRRNQRDLYLQAGYAVFAVDYRLAPETRLAEIVGDVRDALGWLRGEGARRLRIDPKRLAVVGHSAGGYLALMAGCVARPRPQALVAFYGYGDIIGEWYATSSMSTR